jgi:hypothetical protein
MGYYINKFLRYFCCFDNWCIFCKATTISDELLKKSPFKKNNKQKLEFKVCDACYICNEYVIVTYKNPLYKSYRNKYVEMPNNINLIPEDDLYKEYEIYSCFYCHNETTNPFKDTY